MTPWARLTRRTQQAVGTRCSTCNEIAKKAFPHLQWEALVTQAGTDSSTRSQITAAAAALKEKRVPDGIQCETFAANESLAISVKRSFRFVPESACMKVFGASSARLHSLGYTLIALHDETGAPCRGILLSPQSEVPPAGGDEIRTVSVKSRKDTNLETLIHDSRHQLRADQGKDMAKWWNADVLATRPKPFSGAAPLVEDILHAVKRAQELPSQQAATGSSAGMAQMTDDLAEDAAAEADDAPMSEDEPLLQLPSSQKAKGKGKGKNKGKDKDKTDKSRKKPAEPTRRQASQAVGPVTQEPASASCRSRSPRNQGGAASVASVGDRDGSCSVVGSISPQDKLKTQGQKYLQQVSLSKLVCNEKWSGQDLHQAKRVLKAMQERGVCTESVQLASHLNHADMARRFSTANIFSLAAEERTSLLNQLMGHMPEVPDEWAATLLVIWVKDQVSAGFANRGADEAWASAVWPPFAGPAQTASKLLD